MRGQLGDRVLDWKHMMIPPAPWPFGYLLAAAQERQTPPKPVDTEDRDV